MLCEFAPHNGTHVQCTRCRGLFPHGGQPADRVRRTCPGEGQARKLPSLVTRAGNAGQALIRNALNGFRRVPEEIRRQRQSICESNVCGLFGKGWCELCGCHLQTKQSLAAESCPDTPARWTRWTDRQPGPLRVVFLTPSLGMGGAERVILSQCRYFSRFGVDVESVWLHENGPAWGPFLDELSALQIPVYSTTRRSEESMRRSASLVDSLRSALTDADIAISWGLPDAGHLLQAAGWTGPHVLVSHGPGFWASRQMAQAAPSATHFAAVSRPAVEAFPEGYRSQVKILWNGAETERLQVRLGRDQQRTQWGVLRHETLLGYIGRFSFNKHPEAVARAVVELPTNYQAVMIGDGIEAGPIRQLAREIAGDRVTMPGPTDDVGSALAALDCWMLCSQAEGLSIAMCEAMLAGVPIVCTRVGAVDELEQQFGPLFVTVPSDATNTDLARACSIAMSAAHRPIVQRAQQVALEHLTAEVSAQRWAEWLREICPVAA